MSPESPPSAETLLAAFTADRRQTLDLPMDEDAQRAVLYDIRAAILTARDHNQHELADQWVALLWAWARQTGDAEHAACAHWGAGLALLDREKQAARRHLEAAQDFFRAAGKTEEEGRILIGLAFVQGQLGDLSQAEQSIERAVQGLAYRPDYPYLSELYVSYASIEGRLGKYQAMLATSQQAAGAARRFNRPASLTRALINQALAALLLGEFPLAETTLNQALATAREHGLPELAGRAALNLAQLTLDQGHLFAALRWLDQARADFTAAQILLDLATVAIHQSRLFERLCMHAEAADAARQAAETFAQAGIRAESIQAGLIATRLALSQGQPQQARRHLDQAQTVARQGEVLPVPQALLDAYAAHPLLHTTVADRTAALAQADDATRRLEEAGLPVEQLQAALVAAEGAATLRRGEAVRRLESIAAQARADGLPALEQVACEMWGRIARPAAALAPLERAAQIAAQMRRAMPIEEFKASALTGHSPLYARLVAAQLRAGQPIDAVGALIEAKGSLWAEMGAPSTSTAAPDDNQDWLQAKSRLRYWQEQATATTEPAYRAICETRLRESEAALAEAARRQARARTPLALPDLAAIQAQLPPHMLAVDYLVDEQTMRACVITCDDPPLWLELGRTDRVQNSMGRLTVLRRELQSSPSAGQRQRAAVAQQALVDRLLAELGQQLVAPLLTTHPDCDRLVFAPDAFLFGVPWAALRLAQTDAEAVYLGQRYELSIVPSLAVLALPTPPPSAAAPLCLGHVGKPPLAQVEAEIESLRRLFPDGQAIFPARLAHVQWDAPPRCLHIAAHGRIHSRSPLLSGLELEDGALLLADALNLRLHGTRLVTLSACETATTPERGGIALALAGAFLTAGARAVIASLWQVDDAATGLWMTHFYRHWQAGASIPRAVQAAQVAAQGEGYGHPFYWAAFQPLLRGAPLD